MGYILYQTGLINQLRSLEVIGWMSLIFGILLYVSDRSKITKKIDTDLLINQQSSLVCFKYLPLVPGVSRSGITITSGRLLGFSRFDSAKISFFLSIPTLAAASLLGIYNIYKEKEVLNLNFLAIIAVYIFFYFFLYYNCTFSKIYSKI